MHLISARLAIVDGTHLCLLPSSDDISIGGGGSGGGEKDDNLQTSVHSNIRNDNLQLVAENVDRKECMFMFITVPALHLSSVYKVYDDGEFISCSTKERSAEKSNDADEPSASSADHKEEKQQLVQMPIETIRIRASHITSSNINNTENYRFMHSTSCCRGEEESASRIPIKVTVCDDEILDEGIIRLSSDNSHIEVYLPSPMNSDHHLGSDEDEECKLYGGEHYNIMMDDNNDSDNITERRHDNNSFQINGAGSCLVADFLGIAGYEQALVMPQIDANLLSTNHMLRRSVDDETNDREDSTIIQQQKMVLQMILRESVLTDGRGIIQSKYATHALTKVVEDDVDGVSSFTMQPLTDMPKNDGIATDSSKAIGSSSQQQEEAVLQSSPNQSKSATNTDINNTNINSTNTNIQQEKNPAWLEAIAQTVEHRLTKEVEGIQQLERSTQARVHLVRQGRRTLHAASRQLTTLVEDGNWNDPEILRLRYGIRPRTSSYPETYRGISIVLDLELDIMMRRCDDKNEQQTDCSNNVLHDFHISCSLTSNDQSTSSSSLPQNNIRTESGIVPTLQAGDCIALLSSVRLDNLKVNMDNDSNGANHQSNIAINIQGLWVDALTNKTQLKDSSHHTNDTKPTRRGAVLCVLRLPFDSLFTSPPTSSIPRAGHWIQHEIDFITSSDNTNNNSTRHHHRPEPCAIFDYRQPRTLTIDTSSEMNSTFDVTMWKDLVSNLNASICGGGCSNSIIDLYCKKGEPRLKLVIFISNPEERAAIVKLVLRSLPESARLIVEDDDCPEDEKRNIRALVMSLKKEAEALKRHCTLLKSSSTSNKDEISLQPELLTEMAALQYDTDGIASTLKRGWVN